MRKDVQRNRRQPQYSAARESPGRNGAVSAVQREAQYAEAANRRAVQRKKHQHHMLVIFYIFLSLVVIAAAVVLSLTVLFKINSISVTGTSRYTQKQIEQASGIQNGDNLFLIKTNDSAAKIRQTLPYLGKVTVSRAFPTGVKINVEEASEWGAVPFQNGYAVLGKDGTVLEKTAAPSKSCIELKGITLKKAQVGIPAQFSDNTRKGVFCTVMEAIEESGLGKQITAADFTKSSKIILTYENRVFLNLGEPDDLDYKFKFADSLLKNNIKKTEKGSLNLSVVSDTNKAYFDPDYGTSSSSASKK